MKFFFHCLVAILTGKPDLTKASYHQGSVYSVSAVFSVPLLHRPSSPEVLRGKLHHLPGVQEGEPHIRLSQGVPGLSHHYRPER